MNKYVQLYEEYNKSEEEPSESHYSWASVRDAIQTKLPFIIIDFKNQESMDKCIKDELFDENYIRQRYYLKKVDGEDVKYPSVFIFGEGTDLNDRVHSFIKRFDILRIMVGEFGKDQQSLYIEGDQVDVGRNLQTSINIDDMGLEDFYDVDSSYYKFIG